MVSFMFCLFSSIDILESTCILLGFKPLTLIYKIMLIVKLVADYFKKKIKMLHTDKQKYRQKGK